MQTPNPGKPASFDHKAGFEVQAPCHVGFGGMTKAEQAVRAEVLHRAYSIWENSGRPAGSAVSDWLQAETEVLNETKLV